MRWIDNYEGNKVGTIGYLVEVFHENTGGVSWHLQGRPARTNQSHQPRLVGWCGTNNNVSISARGIAKIVKVNRSGDRAQVVALSTAEAATWLEEDGYPELAEQEEHR